MTKINSNASADPSAYRGIQPAIEEIDKGIDAKQIKTGSDGTTVTVKTDEVPDILNALPGIRNGKLTVSESQHGKLKGSGSFDVGKVDSYLQQAYEAAKQSGLGSAFTKDVKVLSAFLEAVKKADKNHDGKVTAAEYNGSVWHDGKTTFQFKADASPPVATPPQIPIPTNPVDPVDPVDPVPDTPTGPINGDPGKMLYTSNFDAPLVFKDDKTYVDNWKYQAGNMKSGQTVADPLGQRSGNVFRIQYDPNDAELITKNAHNPRDELRHREAMQNGQTYDIKFSTLFKDGTVGAIFAQIHGPGTHPPLKLSAEANGDIIVDYRDVPNTTGSKKTVIGNVNDPAFKGRWVDWEITFKPDDRGNAVMSVGANGKTLFKLDKFSTETVNAKTDPDGVGHYFKMGIYKRTDDRNPATMYLDDFKMSVK